MKSFLALRTAVLLCILTNQLRAQGYAVVVHAQPIHTRHFAGTIVDQRGMTVEYATVDLCNPKDHHVLASTFADGRGFFTFDDKKYGKRIELRISQKGFNISQYTAMIRPFADEHMKLVLNIAQ